MRLILAILLCCALTDAAHAGGNVIATGSVTRANMKISLQDGYAHVDFSSVGALTQYRNCYVEISDGTNTVGGWIKDAGIAEATGSDLLTGWNLTSGWTIYGTVTIDDANSFTTVGPAGIYRAITDGILYKVVFARTTTATLGADIYYGTDQARVIVCSGSSTGYGTVRISGDLGYNRLYVRNQSSGTTDVSTLALYQVTAPSATGVIITSTRGGSTPNWAYKHPSFNPQAATFTYAISAPPKGGVAAGTVQIY